MQPSRPHANDRPVWLTRAAHRALQVLRDDPEIHNAAIAKHGRRRTRGGQPSFTAVLDVLLAAEVRRRGIVMEDTDG